MGRNHPAYDALNYKRFRRRLKQAVRDGRPEHCRLAEAKCKKIATIPHHIVPLSAGGSWGDENLMPVCSWCNNWAARVTQRRTAFS